MTSKAQTLDSPATRAGNRYIGLAFVVGVTAYHLLKRGWARL